MDDKKVQLLERQREHFNSIADRYHEGRQASNHRFLKDLMWSDIFSSFQNLKGSHLDVLEPMCGFCDGYDIVRNHLSADISYQGFDYSDAVVESIKKTNPGIQVWQADATKYLPAVDSYDLIILIGGLHHTPLDAQDIVRNLTTGLRTGGLFVSYEPTHGNPLFRMVREGIYKNNSLFDEQTERAFPVSELCKLFVDAGLRRELIRYPGLLSYILYYNPDAFPALNIGGKSFVSLLYSFDKLFYKNAMGRALSFATLSVWQKP
ncbi:class I SAM-dependent methyltransferase [Bradyrhizobium sp. AUGA SZCCT0182]|uniref:class I SAM-dependent methyltransferase n=1 Tax=Bradyrhizobium sp. AUGA SZCCT0182 TaxID=2807667 RepID=UPI001BAE52EF|nr:class I SAM-dependent methyltransferase [Bradyrhizobium sp. AUGA SZCCT0182]MBR1234592.1 class I SAM-dependent methyltransferase [Bradyrhizobium sp. AUGA SZCCT0182]